MALESLVIGGDPHERPEVISRASNIVDMIAAENEMCKKVILPGDWYERFDHNLAAKLRSDLMKDPQFAQIQQRLSMLGKSLQSYVKQEYGDDMLKYQTDLMAGKVPENILGMHKEFVQLKQGLSKYLDRAVVAEEVYAHIEPFLGVLKELKAKGVDIISVLGNHDPVFLPELMQDVNFIGGEDNDPYESEGIIGHNISFPPVGGFPDPKMNAPSGLPGDDDVLYGKPKDGWATFETLDECREESNWYKRNKDSGADIVVAHYGPKIGLHGTKFLGMATKDGDFPSGGGLSAFADDRAQSSWDTLYLSGHIHSGLIYHRQGQLIVNPGPNHVAEVIREDGQTQAILLYEVDKPNEYAADIILLSDIEESKEQEGIVWASSDMLQAA